MHISVIDVDFSAKAFSDDNNPYPNNTPTIDTVAIANRGTIFIVKILYVEGIFERIRLQL
ncbi:hypothetical protein NUZ5A_20126 [Candidatus Nitrosotenuis uzonensis]|uniref:Uncharacterized protein n=1 Tax=Candidatus Nitrosotenuis uzonensis TaxID=1407055 RepID=A0A812EXF7_9ARCH|nr:hypothetical protein NUZ5A_20126 [Candidatus Nitrosotenuis uzonensis]